MPEPNIEISVHTEVLRDVCTHRQHFEITRVRGVPRGETCSAADMPVCIGSCRCARVARTRWRPPGGLCAGLSPVSAALAAETGNERFSQGSHTGHYGQACGVAQAAEGINSHPGPATTPENHLINGNSETSGFTLHSRRSGHCQTSETYFPVSTLKRSLWAQTSRDNAFRPHA
jgi:hypothetical protein